VARVGRGGVSAGVAEGKLGGGRNNAKGREAS
jgi:hypothetical protein